MPSSMSLERRKLLKALGAKLVLTDPALGMKAAVQKAQELQKSIPNAFIPHQFDNMANVAMHRKTTAVEILQDTDNKIDIFVAGSGTSGTVTGVSEVLKTHNSAIETYLVEPDVSRLFSQGKPAPHKIQRYGT